MSDVVHEVVPKYKHQRMENLTEKLSEVKTGISKNLRCVTCAVHGKLLLKECGEKFPVNCQVIPPT